MSNSIYLYIFFIVPMAENKIENFDYNLSKLVGSVPQNITFVYIFLR